MATATEEATVAKPIFTTRVITFIAFTATLIFSQNMLSVSSQIGVGDWDSGSIEGLCVAPFVYTWLVAVHSGLFVRINNSSRSTSARRSSSCSLLQRNLMIQLFYVGE